VTKSTLVSVGAEAEAEAFDTLDAFGTAAAGRVVGGFEALATLEPVTSFGPPAGCFAAELVVEDLGFAALDAGLT